MRSDLHKLLQGHGRGYLLNKSYWITGEEVPMPAGVCDVWGMSRAKDLETMAIEVKVSRGDFRSPSQQMKENYYYGGPMANYQNILCPADLIQPHEVHDRWGLLWWNGTKIINKKRAPFIEMTAEQKLKILLYFLQNGNNPNRPRFPEEQIAPRVMEYEEETKTI